MRICPRCGDTYPDGVLKCYAKDRTCRGKTEKIIEPVPESEIKEDEDGILGRAGEIVDLVTDKGPLTYKDIASELGLSYKRIVRLVSQMVRDGIDLKREGRPRKISLG